MLLLAAATASSMRPENPYTGNAALQFAALQVALGNVDEAFRWLAFEPAHGMLPWVRVDPAFLPLRADPRFAALMRRLNLPDP